MNKTLRNGLSHLPAQSSSQQTKKPFAHAEPWNSLKKKIFFLPAYFCYPSSMACVNGMEDLANF